MNSDTLFNTLFNKLHFKPNAYASKAKNMPQCQNGIGDFLHYILFQEISKFTSGDFLDRLKSQKVKISTSKTSHQDNYAQEDDAMKQEVKVC